MAYATDNAPRLIADSTGSGTGALWVYVDADDISDIKAANYFSNGDDLGMQAGDIVVVINTDDNVSFSTVVSSVGTGGATVDTNVSQELTVSGAVTPGMQSVELNHASTVIAATIADSKDHEGLFVVKDTSASGTAAHTLTLTAGTFNGTATIATLNAPNEALCVWFDSAGDGTIVENVGAVVLS